MRIVLLYILLIGFISCNNQKKSIKHEKIISKKDIVISSLNYDSISLRVNEYLGPGFFKLFNDSIYFFDQSTSFISIFNKKGKYFYQKLGKGRGPGEIKRIDHHIFLNNEHFILNSNVLNVYNKAWELDRSFSVQPIISHTIEERKTNPYWNYPDNYWFRYVKNNLEVLDDRYILTKIEMDHYNFNAFIGNGYYKNSRILGLINIENGKIERVIGGKSKVYLDFNYIPFREMYYYDVKNTNIYISFEPDSLIYILDLNGDVKSVFGMAPEYLSYDYDETNSVDYYTNRDYFTRINREESYHTYIYVSKNRNIVFRQYYVGASSSSQDEDIGGKYRMQIFKDYNLIGDVDVGTGFQIIGESNNYFYAQNDVSYDTKVILKFQIE